MFNSCDVYSKTSRDDSSCNAGIVGVLFNNKYTIILAVLYRRSSVLASGIWTYLAMTFIVSDTISLRNVGIYNIKY